MRRDEIEITVDQNGEVIGGVAQQRQPARMFDHEIEDVAVDHEVTPAVGGFVRRRFHHFDTAEMSAVIIAQELVMIAGQIDQPRALARLAQKLLHDVVVRLWPVPA